MVSFIRGRRDLLNDTKRHDDLFGLFDRLYDPQKSQGAVWARLKTSQTLIVFLCYKRGLPELY